MHLFLGESRNVGTWHSWLFDGVWSMRPWWVTARYVSLMNLYDGKWERSVPNECAGGEDWGLCPLCVQKMCAHMIYTWNFKGCDSDKDVMSLGCSGAFRVYDLVSSEGGMRSSCPWLIQSIGLGLEMCFVLHKKWNAYVLDNTLYIFHPNLQRGDSRPFHR